MVALFVVFFIVFMLVTDLVLNRDKYRKIFQESRKERLVAESAPPELGYTMADGGELIDK